MAGRLDLNPLDVTNPADLAWLEALVWPEQDDRRRRLTIAAGIAAAHHLELRRGDLLHDLPTLAAEAPADATLVVTHSATLAYLTDQQRDQALAVFAGRPWRRIGFEGRGIDPAIDAAALERTAPATPQTLFVAAIDGHPYALADGHGSHLSAYPT